MIGFAGMCRGCINETWKWLDWKGRSDVGIQFQIIANGKNHVPSWVMTREAVNKAVRSIRETCLANHAREAGS